MLGFIKRHVKRQPGWLAIGMEPQQLRYVHGTVRNGKTAITRCGVEPFADDKEFERVARDLGLERYQRLAVLSPTDYQLLLVEAPSVPPAELKNAARWRVKDMLDYPIDEATIDVLDVPPDPAGASRAHTMYAVAARNDVIRRYMERFARARMPLSVIDIQETAQRNLAALLEPPERAIALLYPADDHVMLTVNFRGELYLARRIDVALIELQKMAEGGGGDAENRILLEVQRSLDHLERQFPSMTVAKVLVAPTPVETGLRDYLAENLGIAVEELQLEKLVDFAEGAELDRDNAWRFFHLLGATLRERSKP